MILVKKDISTFVDIGLIEIEPFNPSQLGENSYDVTLSPHGLRYTEKGCLDVKQENSFERFEIPEDGFILEPNELYLFSTNERTFTPKHIPIIEGLSGLARLGINIHITAGYGNIGFNGTWTLEITAVKRVKIYPNMPIAQIIFMSASRNEQNINYNGSYTEQIDAKPQPSKFFKKFK